MTSFSRIAAAAVLVIGGVGLGGVAWSNPHHAYVAFENVGTLAQYVEEVSIDPSPGPTLTLGGSNTGFGGINALAIGPQGNLYASGCFGSPCQSEIEIFAPGANGNVAPIAILGGKQTGLKNPNGMAFDSSGRLYVTQNKSDLHGAGGQIDVFAAGASGNVAPVAVVAGTNTQFAGKSLAYVAVDGAGEIFAGATHGNWIFKFPAGAHGNIGPLATTQVQAATNGFNELQTSGNTVYATVGFLRVLTPTVFELSTADLSPTGSITNHEFAILHADADASGRLYVQNIHRNRAVASRSHLYEYEPGQQQPSRVRLDGQAEGGGYIVVGP